MFDLRDFILIFQKAKPVDEKDKGEEKIVKDLSKMSKKEKLKVKWNSGLSPLIASRVSRSFIKVQYFPLGYHLITLIYLKQKL